MTLSPRILKLLQKIPWRLLISVAAGLLTSSLLSVLTQSILHWAGWFPAPTKPIQDTSMLVTALAFHSLFAIAGAYVTATLAKEQARKAVFVLGSKEAIMWLLGTLLLWNHTPPWFNISKAVLGIPLALLGGYIHAKRSNPERN
jgi:membrane associated rhomboid family serine protease